MTGAVANANAESSYFEPYNVGGVDRTFTRTETIKTDSNSVGIKAKFDLMKWLTLSLAGKQDNYNGENNNIRHAQRRIIEINALDQTRIIDAQA